MTRKNNFFEGCSWFKLNIWGLAHVFPLKFYTSGEKPLRLKVRKVLELSPTLVEVTGKKLNGKFALNKLGGTVTWTC